MGVVHRDVKPGNLLLDKNGQIWVADFGLAKLAASDANVTMTGDTLGTLRYMSPEQAGAKHGLVDARTDVYALGATLYELLTLTPAVDGKDKAEILWKIAEAEPTALRNVNRSIPRDFETVVLKCLAKEPTERYASARELADDLRRYLRFVPPRARRVSRLHRARKWIARRPLIGALAFAVIIATSAAISLGFWAAYREETVRTTREREERQKFFALLEQVRQRRADPVAGWTSANLSDLKELSRSPTAKEHLHDLRTESAAALSALDLVPAGILAEGFQAYSVDFASDGRLAVAQWRATEQGVMEIRLYDSELRQFRTLSLAPDAEWDKWRRRAERSGGFRAVRFSPNGRWLAAGTNDGRLARWDMNDLDAEPKTWIAHRDDHPDFWQSEVRSIGFTTDDVLLSSSRKAIRGWAIATGTPNGLDVRDYQLPLDFHPGKGYLAVYWSNPPAPGVNVNRLLNVATGQIQAGDIPEAYGAGIAPGAGFLANAWSHSSFPYFRSINAAASANYLLAAGRTPTELGARYFHFDRSSSTLAIVEEHDRRLTLSDVASGLLVSESPLPSDAPRAAFAPDGRRLAVAGTHGVSIFDVARDIVETVAVANERLVQNLAATTDHSELVTTAWELNVPGALYRWRLPAFRPILVNSRAKGFQLVADFAPNNRTFVIGVDTEKKYTIETSDGAQFHSTKRIVPRFGPDGRLWILSEDGTLRVATPPNWEQRLVWNNDLASVGLGIVPKSLAVGSDCVLVGRRDGRLYRIDPTAGQTHSWPLFSSAITSLDIASAGDSAVAGTDRGELRFVNPRTGESVEIPNAHRQEVTSIAFGRNLLVTGSADRRVRLWTTDGRPIATFRMSGPVRKILLSADGTSLLVHVDGERAIRRWRLDRLFAEWRALGLGDDLPPI
jgi:WD40 repeat protein